MRFCSILLLLCSALFIAGAAAATATAQFSERVTEVGQAVEFHVIIEGSASYSQAPELHVDGLEIDYQPPPKKSVNIVVDNGRMRQQVSITHVYEVTPQRAGTFTMPAVEIEADGQKLRTTPVALKVQPGGTGSQSVARAEIVPEKLTAYVGEQVPVQVRLLFDPQSQGQPRELPALEGDAFTKLKMQQAGRREVERDGRTWYADIFDTVVTPIRAGTLSLGPVQTTVQVVMPRRNPGNPRARSLFDEFFNDPFLDRMRAELKKLTAPSVEMIIKPLPAAGRPKSFTNAVGQFAMALNKTPARVKINDPVTLRFVVTGKGNFDRISAPQIVNADGWRVYPPTETFTPDNDRVSGTKVFEIAVIPEKKQTQLPVFELAYFDPLKEKYTTLKSPPSAIVVEGEPAPPPPPVAAPAASAEHVAAAPAATPAPVTAPADILGIRYEPGVSVSPRPLYRQPIFWIVQAAPLLVLLTVLARRFRRVDDGRRAAAGWRRERAQLLARLGREQDRHAFYDTAARLLQVETALRTGRAPETIDPATVRRVAPPDDDVTAVLGEIFDTRAEAVYAGAAAAPAQISPPERERVLGAVATLEKAFA